jgi:hypothetical protein
MQRPEQHGERDDDRARQPDHDQIDPPFELLAQQRHLGPQRRAQGVDIGLGGDVVVDRVVDLGRDPLGVAALETGALKGALIMTSDRFDDSDLRCRSAWITRSFLKN